MLNSNNKKILIPIFVLLLILGLVFYYKNNKVSTENNTEDFLTFVDVGTGAIFKYPENIGTKYVSLLDWPPAIQVLDERMTCIDAGEEIARAGRTENRIIEGKNYCVTVSSEGAVGSIYTQYAYASEIENKTVILTFGTRSTQCGNYDDPQRVECEVERENLNIDLIVNKIMSTFKF